MKPADERDRQSVEGSKHAGHQLGVVDVFGPRRADHPRHPGEIGSRAEHRTGARQDGYPWPAGFGDEPGPPRQLLDQLLVEGVANLRPIECDVFNRAVPPDEEVAVSHAPSSDSRSAQPGLVTTNATGISPLLSY